MPTWINEALESAKPYWPFLAQMLVLWYLGQVFKKRVWTKARAASGSMARFMRDTMPFHPLVAGAIWGALWPWMPAVEFVTTRGGAINQGLIAAVCTVVLHTGLDYYASNQVMRDPDSKWGAVLKILRESVTEDGSTVPPPPTAVVIVVENPPAPSPVDDAPPAQPPEDNQR